MIGFGPSLIAPAVGAGRRVGTVLAARTEGEFDEDDWILMEYAVTTVGMVIAQAIDEEEEDEAEGKRMARSAINSLSYSEIRAMQHIFDELEGDEGVWSPPASPTRRGSPGPSWSTPCGSSPRPTSSSLARWG